MRMTTSQAPRRTLRPAPEVGAVRRSPGKTITRKDRPSHAPIPCFPQGTCGACPLVREMADVPAQGPAGTAEVDGGTGMLAEDGMEVLRPDLPRGRFRSVLFDFDGTLSLIRAGWPQVMIPMMVGVLRQTGTAETEAELTV